MKMVYGIVQKWTDQGISADDWKIIAGGNKVESVEILQDFFDSVKYGNKTRYYVNLETAKGIGVNSSEDAQIEESGCEACSI
jgi:ribonucleoside-diphosphate reductase alpha chain